MFLCFFVFMCLLCLRKELELFFQHGSAPAAKGGLVLAVTAGDPAPPPVPHTPRWFPPVVSAAEGGRSRQRGPRGRRAQRAGRTGRCQLPRPGRGSAGRASSQPAETVLVRSRQPPRCPPPAPHFSAPRTWLSKGLCGRNSLGSVTQVPQETGRRQSCACRGALDDPCGGGR